MLGRGAGAGRGMLSGQPGFQRLRNRVITRGLAVTDFPETDFPDTGPGARDDEDLDRQILPLLPLTTGVVFPNMVVTLALETDEARTAAAAAEGEGLVLLVPRVGARSPCSCPTPPFDSTVPRPGGPPALVLRGLS